MNRLRLLAAVAIAGFVAGMAFGTTSAQVPASAAVNIYPRRAVTEARLKIDDPGSCSGSWWYWTVEVATRIPPGSWSSYSSLATVYVATDLDLVCANKYAVVKTLPSSSYTAKFRVTEHEDTCRAPVYECDGDPGSQMLYSYNTTTQETGEIFSGGSGNTWWYYDNS